MSAKTTGSSANNNNSDAKQRHEHHDGSSGRAYTVEQKHAVIRVRKCSPTAFYDILGLEEVKKTCTDGEIKKAYRKLSLLTHPDKNGYQGADEAFKMVARAFQILSDEEKKAKYDRFGGDPESRFGAGGGPSSAAASGASPFSGFARSAGAQRGGMWEEEISPEDLFRQFFGGGGGFGGPFGGGLFDTGPNFVFNMGGGPGIRVQQFGGGRPRRRQHNPNAGPQQEQSLGQAIQSLLPLLILFLIPLLSSLLSSLGGGPAVPAYRFEHIKPYTQQHVTDRLKVPYWTNPSETDDYSTKKWRELDRTAERAYVGDLNIKCEREVMHRDRMVQEAQGFFYTDRDMLRRAREMELGSCRRLRELGVTSTTRF
ncbi:hypothetical protein AAFC00_003664 [Neodothiora populina]|uniref:J domain-containing protein n=1 Tax=Neodothiora populina TaxID=2781224 RepID=A0ABR3PG25_9PEZI